ncbi:BamA/TamA family outer membrane protein [Nostoc sp.]|uniref:BamA/TamA family outer membrane protein n=1 Tax=Nostoc sp. TaxID=1180 RepID=UPI002FFB6A53
MRVSATAIFTLATLAAGNVTVQATAAPAKTVTPTAKAGNLVVAIIEDTPAQVETIASPETIVAQQFSQNPVAVQTGANKNSPVVLNSVQEENSKVILPVSPIAKPTLKPPAENKETNIVDKGNSWITLPTSGLSSLSPKTPATESDLVVTATDVQVVGANQELQQIIRKVIKTQAGGETSQSQLQTDVGTILDTGLFSSVSVNSSSISAGLNVVYQVQPVIVRSLQLSGAKVLTYQIAQQRLQSQIGATISPTGLQQAVAQINKWYADNGYNLARVLSIKPSSQGILTVNVQAGTVLGNLPPYESFNLGGSNSVRGYDSGDVGSGRSYVLASAEYRFPVLPIVGGVLFADFASDLGSGDTVLGDPAGVRGKPGYGFGYGAGVRLNSPLGLIRADYGINDQGESKVHLGIGQRF